MKTQDALGFTRAVGLAAATALAAACASTSEVPPVARNSQQVVDGRLECDLVLQLGDESLAASYGGGLTLSDDETSIVEMEADAYLVVEQRTGLDRRRSEWRPGSDGGVVVDDFVGGRRVVGDAAREAWRRKVLQALVASADLGGEARRERFGAPGGTPAILSHLEERTRGGFALEYLPMILEDPQLEEAELTSVVQRAARLSHSSTALAVLLTGLAERAPSEPGFTEVLLEASSRVSSSSARSEVLVAILEARELGGGELVRLIRATGSLESGASQAYVLSAVAELAADCEEWGPVWIRTASSLSSAAQRAELFRDLLEREDCGARVRLELARASGELSSSSAREDLLIALVPWADAESELFDELLVLLEGLTSSTQQARCARSLLALPGLGAPQLRALSTAVEAISATGTRRSVQEEILERLQGGD